MKVLLSLLCLPTLCLVLSSCNGKETSATITQRLNVETYGTLPNGDEVKVFTLRNNNGMTATVLEYGAILATVEVPDKDGNTSDVTHGYKDLKGWLTNQSYFGATIGRYGNRIAHGKFTIDGKEYTLATNNDPGGLPCTLHGGIKAFDKVLWNGEAFQNANSSGVKLTYVSPEGEEGFPGVLTTIVTYTLNDDNELIWEAQATVEGSPTPINIVHHSYWNLSNDQDTSINDHLLTLTAKNYLPTNPGMIPTGEIAPVAGTPMDFTKATAVGDRVEDDFEALKLGNGYDHCWVLDPLPKGQADQIAATLQDPKTGRTMEVRTDQPGIQFYGGNFLANDIDGKHGKSYPKRSALCLETQNFPDAPNQESFPNSILKPGETYSHRLVHKFSW